MRTVNDVSRYSQSRYNIRARLKTFLFRQSWTSSGGVVTFLFTYLLTYLLTGKEIVLFTGYPYKSLQVLTI